jgi:hypothetical protein
MTLFSKRKKLIVSGCSYTHNYAESQKLEEFPIWSEVLAEKLDMEVINLSECGFGNKAIYTTLVETMLEEKNVGFVVAMWSEFQRQSWYIDTSPESYHHSAFPVQHDKPWRCFLPERIVLDADWHDQFYEPPRLNPKKTLAKGGSTLKYELSKLIKERKLDSVRAGAVHSLGYMFAFQNICENMNIPYLQMQGCRSVMGKWPVETHRVTTKQLAKYIIGSPYLNKMSDNFIGWPIIESIGGYCFDTLLSKHKPHFRISEEDTHPNNKGHEFIAGVMYDEYKKIYS